MQPDTDYTKEVVNTILQQFGGRMALKMIGASGLRGGELPEDRGYFLTIDFKAFSLNLANRVTITLNQMDTYDMKFERIHYSSMNRKDLQEAIKEHEGLYFDQLQEVFEQDTGLYLKL